MTQKRCLNCQDYKPDEKALNGGPLPEDQKYPYSGVCQITNKRMKEGWACGEWTQKEAENNEPQALRNY